MEKPKAIDTAREAANDERVLIAGRLMGAANALEHLLGKALEAETGLDHQTFEVLLVLGRAGPPGLPMKDIAHARVLTSGGVTRLVGRMETSGLVQRTRNPADGRSHLIALTTAGEAALVRATRRHVEHVERLIIELIPASERDAFGITVHRLSVSARRRLPAMP